MTCNPYWDEITAELLPRKTPQDRLDVVARLYHAKLLDMHNFLMKKGHLGNVAAWVHVAEFQKRGLPYEHFLLVMETGSKLKSPNDYDKYKSSEIPDPKKYLRLHDIVIKHMMHGSCGVLNRECPCMVDGACLFCYSQQFSETTQQGKDTYPIYRRRDDGQKVMRYNCHINVEVCSSIKSVKYLYKHIYKGHDRTSFSVDAKGNEPRVINEIKQYRDARMITAIEGVYRLYGFKLFYMWPPILQMQVHLPGMHMIAYNAKDHLQDVVAWKKSQKSLLTKYFKVNAQSAKARQFLYKEFPEHYTWNKSTKVWKPRVAKNSLQIGRLVYVSPSEGDRFYLRVCLNHTRGAKSFEDLRTWRGVTYVDFQAAAQAMGFVATDKSLDDCLIDCVMLRFSCSHRRLFATIMVFCECADIRQLWDKDYESMVEDFQRHNGSKSNIEQLVLRDITHHLMSMGKNIKKYGLPDLIVTGQFVLVNELINNLLLMFFF
jgi:hypothetical protein